jgi:purine-binding chemotaxis protein CheW
VTSMPDPESRRSAAAVGAYLAFTVADEHFAICATAVQEIIPHQPLIPLPQAPAHVHGVVNLRGQVVPVMDLRRRLQVEAQRCAETRPCIVVATLDIGGESARIGILVDDAVDLLEVGPDQLLEVPVLAQHQSDSHCIAGLARSGDELVILLDLAVLVDAQSLSLSDTQKLVERLGSPATDDGDA